MRVKSIRVVINIYPPQSTQDTPAEQQRLAKVREFEGAFEALAIKHFPRGLFTFKIKEVKERSNLDG